MAGWDRDMEQINDDDDMALSSWRPPPIPSPLMHYKDRRELILNDDGMKQDQHHQFVHVEAEANRDPEIILYKC